MTAAHEQQYLAKQSARLRSMAEQVASPVVAGRKSHRVLTSKEMDTWGKIVDVVSGFPRSTEACCDLYKALNQTEQQAAKNLARNWEAMARTQRIGYTKPLSLVGFIFPIPGFWILFGKLLLQLALMWLESNRNEEQES